MSDGGYFRRKPAPERNVAEPSRKHVFHHGQTLDQRIFLEDHADAAALPAQFGLAEPHQIEIIEQGPNRRSALPAG